MSIVDQLPALVGVVVGAAMSFTSTSLTERSRWRRSQAVRWDERRLAAYSDYGTAVKDMVLLANRIAAARGLNTHPQPLDPDDEALAMLAKAATQCSVLSETVRLLGNTDTITAARTMNHQAWQLEWFARGQLDGDSAAWDKAFQDYKAARDEYLRCARQHLQVTGSGTPHDRTWPPRWLPTPPAADEQNHAEHE
ncbi:hypothetical protein [Actinocrispum wychmicini]|uniref:Secreted protein n=1 Tax=Actinocrispum wychmicini TaxID=1213861 RepID=A0A4R2JGD8_9PSEU|nr:hypothetical protein [Actinocrispum wychmicini]TCO55938.1 hypothetical protein EV192_107361 [Actinocrispum wychmicini]